MAQFSEFNPASGSFLVSEPFMLDRTFTRSVILLCDHAEQEGSMGFILNKPSLFHIGDETPFQVYIGGPIKQDNLFFIHRCFDKFPFGDHIVDDIYFGGDSEAMFTLIKNQEVSVEEVKFLLGYASWSPFQLDKEISENSWAVYNKFHSSLAFIFDPEELWKTAIINMGPKYAHIVNFPNNPDLN